LTNCLYCGAVTNADIDHFQGAISKFCKYSNCRMTYQNFKTRIKKNQNSNDAQLINFANLAYTRTIIQSSPAMMWDRQLMFLRRYGNLFINVKS